MGGMILTGKTEALKSCDSATLSITNFTRIGLGCGSINTVMKNTEALVIASKKIGLDVNAEKTKYMVMS
jgi:hypothetical protein